MVVLLYKISAGDWRLGTFYFLLKYAPIAIFVCKINDQLVDYLVPGELVPQGKKTS